jgi:ADP-dependent NAD(P)H-hydrate dehydratase / NAD(P)H-hydrate epimerase
MIPLYSAAQTRLQDSYVIDTLGYPAEQLMELAGKSIAEWLHSHHPQSRVRIYCGGGNNGGDGYVIGRWLSLWGHQVSCIPVMDGKSKECIVNQSRAESLGINGLPLGDEPPEADIYIDAILGTGQRLPLNQTILSATEHFFKGTALRYTVDILTGVNPDTGHCTLRHLREVEGTFALGQIKSGHYCGVLSGQIIPIDIGLSLATKASDKTFPIAANVIQANDICFPPIESNGYAKWNRGHVAIMAKRGAAVLAAHAALFSGAGMVSILAPKSEWVYFNGLLPEIILGTPESLCPSRHDALVIGPALGFDSSESVLELWTNFPNPMVVDADALRILSSHKISKSLFPRVLTPHVSEAAALLDCTRSHVEENPYKSIQKLHTFGQSLLKGPYTKISGKIPSIIPVSNFRLATAGSGDVLSGLIGTLLARGFSTKEATINGAWVHAHCVPDAGTCSASTLLDTLRNCNFEW